MQAELLAPRQSGEPKLDSELEAGPEARQSEHSAGYFVWLAGLTLAPEALLKPALAALVEQQEAITRLQQQSEEQLH